jgi:glycosyltransferase involved in cell wall biosynthesis
MRAAVIVAGLENQARRACARAGLEPVVMLSREDCTRRLLRARLDVARSNPSVLAIYSADWQRQSLQPLFQVAAALIPSARRLVLIGEGTQIESLSTRGLWLDIATLPAAGVAAARGVWAEMRRFGAIVREPPPSGDLLYLDGGAVLAIWRGDPATTTGGAVTHAAGMLGALRRRGLRVGLLTMCEPPPQVRDAIDDVEVAAPLPRSERISREVEDICLNRSMVEAGERLLRRLRPGFIYQRYDGFMTCGMELSAAHRLPLVLEWNGSAVWVRRNWRTQRRVTRLFDRFLLAVERGSLGRSLLVRAVSGQAAQMAVECGAPTDHVIPISNAVDVTAIPYPQPPEDRNEPPVIGWVGSFGPWHGASVLIEAMARLHEARAVLIGEGPQREACMALARELGAYERIEWTGMLPHREAVARLSACDVLASPHVSSEGRAFFGSPTKVFEFMAIGRPLVASALEQIDDVLGDGRTAILVRPGDVDDLVRGLREVLAYPDRGRALGLAARTEVESHHTWDARAANLIERLESSKSTEQRAVAT